MNEPMRLFERRGYFYIHFTRGKKKSLKTKNEKEAQAIFREIQRAWLQGRLLDLDAVRKVTISELKETYEKSRLGISKWTIKKDMLSLKLLQDALGDIPIQMITAAKIEEFKRICLYRKCSAITVNGYLRHIKAALRFAKDDNILKACPKIRMIPVDRALPRILMADEIKKILDAAKEKDYEFWRYLNFLIWTGARRREALSITWQDIRNNVCILRLTKGRRERIVPLVPQLVEALGEKRDIGNVFVQYHPDTISHMFQELAASFGIKARLHDLRHSAATYMLKSGIPIHVVKDILGHAHISTTMIYSHVLEDILFKEMEKLRFE